jgi:hypothetical protein
MIYEVENKECIVTTAYSWTAYSGNTYYPRFIDGKWFLVGQIEFSAIAHLCRIPEDEATFLKLKYGG